MSNAPTGHSELLGGSSAERRYNCGASYRLEPGLVGFESKHAKRGTRLHEAIAAILKGKEAEGVTPAELSGVIDPAIEAFDELCSLHKVEKIIVERQVAPDLDEELGSFGTVDAIGIGERVALFVDWKFGFHPVDAKDNKQLAFYAYSALTDKKLQGLFPDDPQIVTAIIQPSRGNDMVSVALTTSEALFELAEVWQQNYKERENSAPVKGDWCQWCKAKPSCSAHAIVAPAQQAGMFIASEEPTVFDMGDTETLGDQLKHWLAVKEQASGRVTALERLAYAKIEDGGTVSGWKLVAKRAQRAWHDPEAAERSLRREIGVDTACPRKLITPPQAEKIMGERYKKLERYVTKESTGAKLVPDADERAPVDLGSRFKKLSGDN